jgi:uncharacterized membrane protein YhhN
MRLIEAALFAAPLVLFLLGHLLARRAVPPRPLLLAVLGGLALIGIALFWTALNNGGTTNATYHPATMQAGHVVPGRLGP